MKRGGIRKNINNVIFFKFLPVSFPCPSVFSVVQFFNSSVMFPPRPPAGGRAEAGGSSGRPLRPR